MGRPPLGLRLLCWTGLASTVALLRGFAVSHRHRKTRQSQRLQDVSPRVFAQFERLVQELAHEIRNPLTAINARLYRLQKKLGPGTPELRDARAIAAEIKRLDQILEDFRTQRAAVEPRRTELSGDELLAGVRELFTAQFERQGIELRCQSDTPARVWADPKLLKQVLINLVKNAAESILQGQSATRASHGMEPSEAVTGPGTGHITVRIRSGEAQLQGRQTPVCVIEVADDGPGIPVELKSRLLDPFFSTKATGTGLGLTIASRIIAQHEGAVEFESEPGQGAVFRILLPAPGA